MKTLPEFKSPPFYATLDESLCARPNANRIPILNAILGGDPHASRFAQDRTEILAKFKAKSQNAWQPGVHEERLAHIFERKDARIEGKDRGSSF